ncbi:MAG: hypothetical protein ACOYWZ_22610 [Bacillota bacterium]
MINRKNITKEQALYAVGNGEFSNEVVSSNSTVVVIMTQDWCPQWKNLSSWIYDVKVDKEIDIYELIYNKTDYFEEFAKFKETEWKNDQIPYLRYYKNGSLFNETNYVDNKRFIEIAGS